MYIKTIIGFSAHMKSGGGGGGGGRPKCGGPGGPGLNPPLPLRTKRLAVSLYFSKPL